MDKHEPDGTLLGELSDLINDWQAEFLTQGGDYSDMLTESIGALRLITIQMEEAYRIRMNRVAEKMLNSENN